MGIHPDNKASRSVLHTNGNCYNFKISPDGGRASGFGMRHTEVRSLR
jgi:hypothetical protein